MSLQRLEELPIIDHRAAMVQYGEDSMLMNLLPTFEDMSLGKDLIALKVGIDELDFYVVRAKAHSLKGASGYMCARRLYLIAEKLQFDVDRQQTDEVFLDYAILIRQCILVKREIRLEIAKSEGRYFVFTSRYRISRKPCRLPCSHLSLLPSGQAHAD